MTVSNNYEPWVWTELLAFDNAQKDGGAAEYIKELGFVPKGICLMTSSPDFALNHPGKLTGRTLPADICARDGQPGNERRQRQEWTDLQLRDLISALKAAGSKVYCSMFTVFKENRFTKEWLSDHEEVRLCWASFWRGQEINPLAQLKDGTLFEDIWIPKVIEVCRDYGFDGWHGPDGWGPWSSGNIVDLDFSDSLMPQFLALHKDWDLPECLRSPISHIVTQDEVKTARKNGAPEPKDGLEQLGQRAKWICENHFIEWRDFLSQRWEQFWRKMINALHANGYEGVINSAWTKGCFDALNEYGIDYRKIAALGVDAMVVETVALGMSMMRPEITYMHDGLPMAMAEIKAAAPQLKLIMLHGIKDVVEFWDNLRQAPSAYERELYKLSSLFLHTEKGLQRASSGLLACLADGITKSEWDYMTERWNAAFNGVPQQAGMSVLYFDEQAYASSEQDYRKDGFMPALDQAVTLMENKVPLQTYVRWEQAASEPGILIVPGAHLAEQSKLATLLAQRKEPTVLVGRSEALAQYKGMTFTDGAISIVIANAGLEGCTQFQQPEQKRPAPGYEFVSFYDRRYRKEIAPELWKAAADKILELSKKYMPYISFSNMPCSILVRKFSDKEYEVAVEARAVWGRAQAIVTMPGKIASTRITSPFPPRVMSCEDNCFKIPVPTRGVTSVHVTLY